MPISISPFLKHSWLQIGTSSWLFLLLLPLLQKDPAHVITQSYLLSALYIGQFLLGLLLLAITFQHHKFATWRKPTLPTLWGSALVFSLVNLFIGDKLHAASFAWQIAFYGGIIFIVSAITIYSQQNKQPIAQPVEAPSRQTILETSLVFGLLTFAHNMFILWGYGVTIDYDSLAYMGRWAWFANRDYNIYGNNHYTLPYKLLNSFLNTYDNVYPLVVLQMILAALVVGYLVYTLAHHDFLMACLCGFALAINVTLLSYTVRVGTEGLTSILFILLIAVLLDHYRRREQVTTGELFLWGLGLTLGLTVRPSNVYLLPILLIAYIILIPNWRKTAGFVFGGAVMLLLILHVTNWRFNTYRLTPVETGIYVTWPLFIYDLYDPANGTASQVLFDVASTCDPTFNDIYKTITLETSNDYFYQVLFPCLRRMNTSLKVISDAYIEGILKTPFRYTQTISLEHSRFLGIHPSLSTAMKFPNITCDIAPDTQSYQTCIQADRLGENSYPSTGYLKTISPLAQLYFWLTPQYIIRNTTTNSLSFAGAWLLLIVFLLLVTRGSLQFVIVMIFFLSYYLSFSVVVGHVLLGRYTGPLDPLYSIFSVILVVTVMRVLFQKEITPSESLIDLIKPRQIFQRTAYIGVILFGMGLVIMSPSLLERPFNQILDALANRAIQTASTSSDYYRQPEVVPPYVETASDYLYKNLHRKSIFNPRIDNLNWVIDFIFFHERLLTPEESQLLMQWRNTFDPCLLTQLGIEYLVFGHTWAVYDADISQIQSNTNYELRQYWEGDPNLGEFIILYQVSCLQDH